MYPTKKLWEICEKITDWTHQTPTYVSEWIIFLSSKNVTTWKIDWENIKYINYKQHLEMSKRISPQKWDILLAKNWTTWVAAIVDKDNIFDIYVSLALLRPGKTVLVNFLWYFLNSHIAKKQFSSKIKWSGVPNLHLKEIKEVIITLPPLSIQQKIVVKLDSLFEKLDQAITLTKQNLANIEELNKSVLEKIFTECEGKYEKRKLEEVCVLVRWPFWWSLKKEIFVPEWYAVYEQQHAINNQFEQIRYFINEEKFNGMKRFELFPWDLIMSCSGTMWKIAIVPEKIIPWIINQALLKITAEKSKLFSKYLINYINSSVFQKILIENSQWAAIKNIASVKDLKQITIPLPPIAEQQKIVEYLDNIFAKNKILQEKYKQDLKNFEELKQSILKQAFEDEDFIK